MAKLLEQANKIRNGKALNIKLVNALRAAISELTASNFSDDPATAWLTIKHMLRASNQDELMHVAAQLDFLVAFRRGHRISAAHGRA